MKAIISKHFVLILSLVWGGCRHTETASTPLSQGEATVHVNPEVLATQKLDWTAKSQYVDMKVPYEPIAQLKKEIEAREGVVLQSRGEAHITVITPPEMTVLRTRLSLEQINGTIEKSRIQSIPIQLQCVGRGQLKQADRKLATYFIVVQAPGLLQVREKLRQQFIAAGGEKQAFSVERFRPHITVGFTERDLHPEDGVIKDSRSCLYKVE
ncbi:MAG TPA: 2'-5' RNA ligase family protein [Oligoflexus sp.]|uniref:2'-5' RNA ligase family protein n=1 Tax=Oligoflexus sp. TaxID=1971216 RepID=UPI002D80E624|nr:2'-5' RNA ligase family protein [Oligoflexus sp.]HET9239797.1 2'-5' RNA ligase family protein [Oligoflexus sp.]